MDTRTLSGCNSDQPTSTHDHDGLWLLSLVAATDTSTGDHEIPVLKAETSKSVSSQNLSLSFQEESNKKLDNIKDGDLFSGSGEEYQPSSIPSSNDHEALYKKKKKSSILGIPEKDHCHQSSGEHEELEPLDFSTKDRSHHPPDQGKHQGGEERQKVGTKGSWSSDVPTDAQEDSVPFTKDVIALHNYLRYIEDESKAILKKNKCIVAYKWLCESLLAQITVFNRMREGAQLITLKTYQEADTAPVNKVFYDTLSPLEKLMSHRLTQIVTRGKKGRRLPILLLEQTRASLDFLITKRNEVGVLQSNPYLFAGVGTATYIRVWYCLKKYATECKASNPLHLTSLKYRKHLSTLCQLLNLDHQELEQVARFTGEDIRVHGENSHQTDTIFQVARIGKLLVTLEQGAESLKGRKLHSVVFDERHEPPQTCSRKDKEGQTSDADKPLQVDDDADLPHLSTSRGQMKTATQSRQHENAGSERDVDEEEPPQALERPPVDWSDDEGDGQERHSIMRKSTAGRQKNRATAERDDYDADKESEDDVDKQHQTTRRRQAKRRKTATKHDDDDWGDDETDGAEKPRMNTRPPTKRQKKTSTKRKHAADSGVKLQVRRPWTDQEKKAVQRAMAQFIVLRKVPGKKDCLRCIGKEYPFLGTRTWKDIKYFVCNEII